MCRVQFPELARARRNGKAPDGEDEHGRGGHSRGRSSPGPQTLRGSSSDNVGRSGGCENGIHHGEGQGEGPGDPRPAGLQGDTRAVRSPIRCPIGCKTCALLEHPVLETPETGRQESRSRHRLGNTRPEEDVRHEPIQSRGTTRDDPYTARTFDRDDDREVHRGRLARVEIGPRENTTSRKRTSDSRASNVVTRNKCCWYSDIWLQLHTYKNPLDRYQRQSVSAIVFDDSALVFRGDLL